MDDLSFGLPQLITAGNQILRADTLQPVLLRGINRSGLEYTKPSNAGWLAAAQFTEDEVHEIAKNWRANVIRVPFNQAWALAGANGHSSEEYLGALDQVIAWAAQMGAYTILDLQWLDIETVFGTIQQENQRVANHVPPLPNPGTVQLWRTLAARYRDEPAVIFDLLNEPHDRLDDDPHPLWVVGPAGVVNQSDAARVTASEWVPWAALLIDEIRAVRPRGLILVGGIDWAFDPRHIRVESPDVIYSAHIYPVRNQGTWRRALGHASELPVLIAEWGGGDGDLDFARTLAAVMNDAGVCWCAWSWSDYPHLVQPPRAPAYRPTPFGQFVRAQLAASV